MGHLITFTVAIILFPAVARSQVDGCVRSVTTSVPSDVNELTAIMQDPDLFPLNLYLAEEDLDSIIYGCYQMNSDFSMSYYNMNGSELTTLVADNVEYASNTILVSYTVSEYLLGGSYAESKIQLNLVSIDQNFMLFDLCYAFGFFNWFRASKYYYFAKNGVDTSGLDYRCVMKAFGIKYDRRDTFPKGVCV